MQPRRDFPQLGPGFFLTVIALGLPSVASAEGLGLRETIEQALRKSPAIHAAEARLRSSELEESNATSRLLPSLDLSATHGLQGSSPRVGSEPWASRLTLGLTETLYDNGVTLTRRSQAGLRREQASVTLTRERNRICRDLGVEFYRYSLAVKLLETQKQQNALLKKQFESLSGLYHQGMRPRKDYLRFRTQLSRSEIDLLNANQAIELSRVELSRLMAVPVEGEQKALQFAAENPGKEAPDVPAVAPALRAHPDFRIADLERSVQNLETDLARRRYWPEVLLTSGATWETSDYIPDSGNFSSNGRLGWTALVTLKYNLWDWGIRRREVMIARENELVRGSELDNEVLTLRSDIDKLMIELRRLKEAFELSRELLKLEETNYSNIEVEYRQGRVPYLDLIEVLTNLSDARVKYYTSLFELKQGLLSYRYHEGTLYDWITGK